METQSRHHIAIPPGFCIEEMLNNRGMTQKEFAARMGLSEKHVCHLIKGDVQLTGDVARKLEFVLGPPASFWNGFEAEYRETLMKVAEENMIQAELGELVRYQLQDMQALGWIQPGRKRIDKVIELRKFFEVSSLQKIPDFDESRLICKAFCRSRRAEYALRVWAQKAKLESREMDCGKIDLRTLQKILPELMGLLRQLPIDRAAVVDRLRACGVALVFLPPFPNVTCQGVCFKAERRIVIALHQDEADPDFRQHLSHELAHVLLGHLDRPYDPKEEEEVALFQRLWLGDAASAAQPEVDPD